MKNMRFAIIGFGEVGQIFARDLDAVSAPRIAAFDIAFAQPDSAQSRAAAERASYVKATATPEDAAREADVIFVSVTAGSALQAARSIAGGLAHGPFVVDVNSVSPSTKQEAAAAVAEAGGRYVEAAVMTSVPPHGIRSPMLLGGAHAAAEHFAQLVVTAFGWPGHGALLQARASASCGRFGGSMKGVSRLHLHRTRMRGGAWSSGGTLARLKRFLPTKPPRLQGVFVAQKHILLLCVFLLFPVSIIPSFRVVALAMATCG